MKLAAIFGKLAALLAVFLCIIGCSGSGDDFEPALGASIESADLESLIMRAVNGFDLEVVTFQSMTIDEDSGFQTCLQAESGSCLVDSAPGLAAYFHGANGTDVLLKVRLALDRMEASHLVDNTMLSRSSTSAGVLRILYEAAPVPSSGVSDPCDSGADPTSDAGCAWQHREAPDVGDAAEAMKSDALDSHALSAVTFARASVFADVEIVTEGVSAPDALADGIAGALDEQIKQALSR